MRVHVGFSEPGSLSAYVKNSDIRLNAAKPARKSARGASANQRRSAPRPNGRRIGSHKRSSSSERSARRRGESSSIERSASATMRSTRASGGGKGGEMTRQVQG